MVENVETDVAEILRGSNGSRIKEVTRLLNEAGVSTADDLKYFDWKSLDELKAFSTMEINKIMRFVQQSSCYPEEYKEHKKKRNKETALQRETEISNLKIKTETWLQNEKLKLMKDKDEEIIDGYVMLEKEDVPSNEYSWFGLSWIYGIVVSYLLSIFSSSSETIRGPEKCIDDAVAEIFKDSIRIEFITDVLKREGVRLADDLKYFDKELLESLGGLEEVEINKILRFIEEKYPEMYKQHNQKNTKTYLLNDLLKLKIEAHNLKQPSFIAKLFSFLKPSDFMKYAAKCKSTGMKDDFHENNAKQKKKFKGPSKYENIEEVISEIFAGFSNEARINQIKHILHEDVITRADELSCFDWKSLEDLGLTSSEAARIMDFVKENFPKHFKIHEIRRDEANRMQEELSKCKDEIINLSNLEILQTWEEHSNSQAEKYYSNDRYKDTNSNINTKIELSTEEAVAKILEGCNSSRLIFVTRMLMEEGAQNSKELKSFNRNSLEGLGILEKEEIDKFLKFIQES